LCTKDLRLEQTDRRYQAFSRQASLSTGDVAAAAEHHEGVLMASLRAW
jgi:hypothetical protein